MSTAPSKVLVAFNQTQMAAAAIIAVRFKRFIISIVGRAGLQYYFNILSTILWLPSK